MNWKLFQRLFSELLTNYKQEKTEFFLETAYNYLAKHLSDEELEIAVRRALIEESFFPTPKRLVELVKGSQDLQAGQEWDLVLQGAARGLRLHELEASNAAKFAVQHIGGLTKVGQANEDKLYWLKREFVGYFKSYQERPDSHRQLPQGEDNIVDF